jgi:hypothetical protein
MSEQHLTPERISALLEEPWADMEAGGHLEGCSACRRDYEHMSRMRMALSALDDLEPPPGEWAAIEARLDASPYVSRNVVPLRRPPFWRAGNWPLQAAAAFALFAGGLLAGTQLVDSGPPGEPFDPDRLPVAVAPVNSPDADLGPEEAYLSTLARLDAMRSPVRLAELEREDGTLDPMATAQLLAQLNALILASQAAVEESPGDPVVNEMLFQLMEQREAITNRMYESTRLTSTESW